MNNENDLTQRCNDIEAVAIEALNRVYDIQLTLNELSNQFRTLQYDFNIQNRSKEAVESVIKVMVNKLISVVREGDFNSLDEEEFSRELTKLFYEESEFLPF